MTQPASGSVSIGNAIPAAAFASMFQSIAGLRNFRGAAAMMSCFVAGILVAGLVAVAVGQPSAGKFAISGLIGALFLFTGIHAAGVLLMDQARGIELRSLTDAVVYGLLCVPKTIALIVCLLLASIAVYVVLAALFFLCKIPGLGPVFFAAVFPLAVLVAGLTTTALMLALQLALSAFWDGASIAGALAISFTILRRRLVEAVLLFLVEVVIAGVVFLFVAGVLLFGFWPALGMSVSIVGVHNLGDMSSGLASFIYGAGGYALSGALGIGILWALVLTLQMQVALLGANIVYLRLSEGLDSSAVESAMKAQLDEARRRAAEMGRKAKETADRARLQAEQAMSERRAVAAPQAAAAAPAATSAYPQCNAAMSPVDAFCGNCGFRLKQSA